MHHRWIATTLSLSLIAGTIAPHVRPVFAEDANGIKEEVDQLNSAVKEKQNRVKELNGLISGYQTRIKDQESKQASLANELVILENRIQEKTLRIERTKTEIEALTLEIQQLEQNLVAQEARITKQKELIAELMRRIHQADEVSTLDVFLTQPSLSSFFDRMEELKRVERDLGGTIEGMKKTEISLRETQQLRDKRRTEVVQEQKDLKEEQTKLSEEKSFKVSLVAETEQSQEEFQRILYELRQQQQSTADDIANLQDKLKGTLDKIDESLARGDILLNWPVNSSRGISAHFHDSSYPFRNLFEHPGTDIRVSVGTPVHAAAGGYVAWNRIGKQYGNYTMIIHPGGIATIYAHLSKFMAKPDTYVDRGDIIGLSGGRPGDQGAGLSTGPHLHFEVRQNGIPVNAENFLPDLPE